MLPSEYNNKAMIACLLVDWDQSMADVSGLELGQFAS
jgi:hypothetical protein